MLRNQRSLPRSTSRLVAAGLAPAALLTALAVWAPSVPAQGPAPANKLGDGPWVYNTAERNTKVQLSIVTRGLSHPWSLAFLPNGDMLVTERQGRLRLIHNGVTSADSVADISKLSAGNFFDIALHPKFTENGWVYFSYMKTGTRPDGSKGFWATTAVARGKWDGQKVANIADVFVADAWDTMNGGDGARIVFGPDGKLYLSSSHRSNDAACQRLDSHIGKILRLNDDGTAPPDNPFVGQAGAKPEIFTLGHRTVLGLTFNPQTGELWETENGPQGGDEVNILHAGKNYGWPVVSYGRDYDGKRWPLPYRADLEAPELFWVPSITASGIQFYSGDKFPTWKGNLFLGAMTVGRLGGTGHVQRIRFNENGEQGREMLFQDLHQRFRDVRQGPDGLLYFLTDENDGALLKVEPAK